MLLGADLVLNLTIYAFLGPTSPFFLYTLGTPLLAGMLFREIGAAVLLGWRMLGGYYVLVVLSGDGADRAARPARRASIQTLVTCPVLYPLAAAGGAAVRNLLDRQAATQLALRSAERRAAAGGERARVAREMHDSLGKTLYGIALAAPGRWRAASTAEAPGRRARRARPLGRRAGRRRGGARADLRPALGHAGPPLGARWPSTSRVVGDATGSPPTVQADGVDLPQPGHALRAVLHRPARRCENVERHARPRTSRCSAAARRAPDVVLVVADDGVGIDGSGDAR